MSPAEGVDEATFRSIMSAFPSGVTVVTTVDADGAPAGLTCSAVCSVSQAPPLLLVCVNGRSAVLRTIRHNGVFAVNFLRDNRERVSALFASPGTRFSSVTWQPTRRLGLPWLPLDTIAYADCRVWRAVEAGDHTVLIGSIVDGQAREEVSGPLMYWRRKYGRWPTKEEANVTAVTLAAEG
jgi:flavin reductase (NADH)